MYRANVSEEVRYLLWKEAFKTATLLDGLIHLRAWGEAGTVKIVTSTIPKIHDRGEQCIFLGYSLDHAGDTYRMWNPKTEGLHNTIDVIWLKRVYFTKQPPTYDVVIESVEHHGSA